MSRGLVLLGGTLLILATGIVLAQANTGWTSRQDGYTSTELADGGWHHAGTAPTLETHGLPLVRAGLPALAYRVTSVCPAGLVHVAGTLSCYFRSQALQPQAWARCDSALDVTITAAQRIYTAPNFLAKGYGAVEYVPDVTCGGTPTGAATGYRALEVVYGQ